MFDLMFDLIFLSLFSSKEHKMIDKERWWRPFNMLGRIIERTRGDMTIWNQSQNPLKTGLVSV